jgi:hypothetical protein
MDTRRVITRRQPMDMRHMAAWSCHSASVDAAAGSPPPSWNNSPWRSDYPRRRRDIRQNEQGETNMSANFRNLIPSLAVLSLVGTATLVVPSVVFAADNLTAADKVKAEKPIDHAEVRIKELHDKLHITSDQEASFGKLADVMRDNAKQMSGAIEKREAAEKTATALDDLKAYQAIAEAHADGLKSLVPAFESLYSSLSDGQKKEADALFTHKLDKKAAHKS